MGVKRNLKYIKCFINGPLWSTILPSHLGVKWGACGPFFGQLGDGLCKLWKCFGPLGNVGGVLMGAFCVFDVMCPEAIGMGH